VAFVFVSNCSQQGATASAAFTDVTTPASLSCICECICKTKNLSSSRRKKKQNRNDIKKVEGHGDGALLRENVYKCVRG
jgi:hypothetical protein